MIFFFDSYLTFLLNFWVKSWASLVDKTALEGIPPGERKRQEVNVYLCYLGLF